MTLPAWDHRDPRTGTSMPAPYFYDPSVLEEEKRRIFFRCWHLVGHTSEFGEPGAFVVHDIFDQSVVVIAGRDGIPRGFHNACRHRGNRLVTARRGRLGQVLRCAYHSWCYGHDGALRSAPRTQALPRFDRADWGLVPVRTETFAGFVYVNLDPDSAPVADLAPGAEAEMRHYLPDLDRLTLVEEVDVPVAANWKVIQENSIEGYHFDYSGPVHRQLAALIDFGGYRLTPKGNWWTYIGPPRTGVTAAYGVSLEGATWQTDHFFNLGLWPTTTLYSFPYCDMVGTFIMIPTGPETSLLRFGYYAPTDRPVPELTKAAIRWMNQELGPEDIELNVTNQKGLHSMGFGCGRYLIDPDHPHQSEHLVHHFHTLCYEAIRG